MSELGVGAKKEVTEAEAFNLVWEDKDRNHYFDYHTASEEDQERFIEYTEKVEFNDENIRFINQLYRIKDMEDKKLQDEALQTVYNEYIKPGAPSQVNISSFLVQRLTEKNEKPIKSGGSTRFSKEDFFGSIKFLVGSVPYCSLLTGNATVSYEQRTII